jgi:hypothetical protein
VPRAYGVAHVRGSRLRPQCLACDRRPARGRCADGEPGATHGRGEGPVRSVRPRHRRRQPHVARGRAGRTRARRGRPRPAGGRRRRRRHRPHRRARVQPVRHEHALRHPAEPGGGRPDHGRLLERTRQRGCAGARRHRAGLRHRWVDPGARLALRPVRPAPHPRRGTRRRCGPAGRVVRHGRMADPGRADPAARGRGAAAGCGRRARPPLAPGRGPLRAGRPGLPSGAAGDRRRPRHPAGAPVGGDLGARRGRHRRLAARLPHDPDRRVGRHTETGCAGTRARCRRRLRSASGWAAG